MESKTFKTGTIQMTLEKNGFPKGLILKRNLDFDECKYLMEDILGIFLGNVSDFFDIEEYNEYCDELVENVTIVI